MVHSQPVLQDVSCPLAPISIGSFAGPGPAQADFLQSGSMLDSCAGASAFLGFDGRGTPGAQSCDCFAYSLVRYHS